MYVLKIVSVDKILCFINTFIIIITICAVFLLIPDQFGSHMRHGCQCFTNT